MAPVHLLSESATEDASSITDALVHPETQDLRLEAQLLVDFLTHADFSSVWESKAAQAEVVKTTDEGEDGAKREIEVLPGWVVAASIDESDLEACFDHYIEAFADRVFEKDNAAGTLENKAMLAQFGIVAEATGHKRGWARKAQKGGAKQRRNVVRQMLAMIQKGVLRRAPKGAGSGDFGGDYKKGKGYKTGGSSVGKQKAAKYKKANIGKIKRAAKRAGVKTEGETWFTPFDIAELDDYAEFGLGEPVDTATGSGALYSVESRDDVETSVAQMSERFGKKRKGSAMKKGGKKEGMNGCGDDDEYDESVEPHRGVSLAKGILGLHEGAGMLAHVPAGKDKEKTAAS
jgi:hypothetical protein